MCCHATVEPYIVAVKFGTAEAQRLGLIVMFPLSHRLNAFHTCQPYKVRNRDHSPTPPPPQLWGSALPPATEQGSGCSRVFCINLGIA